MIYVGIAFLILCGVLLLVRRSQQGKLAEITSAETFTARQLVEQAKYVAERMGEAGNFNKIGEVKGIIKCDSPITSELAQQPCVFYSMNVTREYEETYWETDVQSKQQVSRTRSGSDTVANNSQRLNFWVEDATGRTLVDPTGANIDPVQIMDRFEPGQAMISVGGFSLDLGGILPLGGSGRRITGYRYKESILPLERQVYVLGQAVDAGGGLVVRKPTEKGRKFLISLKSEEELIRSTGSKILWLLVGSVGSGVLGAVLIVLGLFRK